MNFFLYNPKKPILDKRENFFWKTVVDYNGLNLENVRFIHNISDKFKFVSKERLRLPNGKVYSTIYHFRALNLKTIKKRNLFGSTYNPKKIGDDVECKFDWKSFITDENVQWNSYENPDDFKFSGYERIFSNNKLISTIYIFRSLKMK